MAVIAGGSSQPNNSSAIAAAAAFIFMFSLFFPTGFLGLTFLYAAEIAPLSHRSSITAISTSSAWLFNFVRSSLTLPVKSFGVLIISSIPGCCRNNSCWVFHHWIPVPDCLCLYQFVPDIPVYVSSLSRITMNHLDTDTW